ncbi:MAG: curli assembly protein CsgF [Vibrio sp.]
MQYNKLAVVLAISLGSTLSAANATGLVYTPVNPSFGGNPLNSSHLMNVANAINDYKDPDSDEFEETSLIERLQANLESRFIGELLGDVGNGNSGQLETNDFILNMIDDGGRLTVQIVDKSTGETSQIEVSGLIQ